MGCSHVAKEQRAGLYALCFFLIITLNTLRCDANDDPSNELKLYKKLFKVKRKEHIVAVQKLILESSIENRAKLIEIMMKTIANTILTSAKELEASKVDISDGFPTEIALKDALAKILENTALFTDLIVRFPEISQRFYKQHKKQWKIIFDSAIETCNRSGVYDDDHQLILTSLKQELGIGEVDPSYVNPFKDKSGTIEREPTQEERKEMYREMKRKAKLAKRKRPYLSRKGHSEL